MSLTIRESRPLLKAQSQKNSCLTKFIRKWMFIYEIILKDFCALNKMTYYTIKSCFNKNPYNLNPKQISLNNGVAKIVLLLNGAGGKPTCFFPLAKKFQEAGVKNVFTKQVRYYDNDAIPTRDLQSEIERITAVATVLGAKKVDFCVVGHSFGGMIAAKHIWLNHAPISTLIVIGSRLRYVDHPFSWYNINPEINLDLSRDIKPITDEIMAHPEKASVLSLWGTKDALVPEESVNLNLPGDKNHHIRLEGSRHFGSVFDQRGINAIVAWTVSWNL